ncbi:MAG: DUF3772 domain-containing protein, partial [Acidiferrobacterales bacterium]|nr:DUF3772 domain-containing protein [Acidiferrobacterales bacterium]
SDETFSFTESLEILSNYEKDIVRIGSLDRAKSDNIREAVTDIYNQSETQLSKLDSQIRKKRERLAALLEEPQQALETDTDSESKATTPVIDQALLRNQEALEVDLVSLETARKKASLLSVYANDLLVQLAAQTSKQSQQQLLYKSPSMLKLNNWQTAYQSIPEVGSAISGDILRWVVMVTLLGLVFIFGFGPVLHRSFQQNYQELIPTTQLPKWSLLAIFVLALIANCFYFVFVTQELHLELTFLILLVLNTALAVLLFRRLGEIRFASQKNVIDGELVAKERHLFSLSISVIRLLTILAAIVSFLGYSVLGMYVLHNIVITLTAIALFLSLRGLWITSEQKFTHKSDENPELRTSNQASLLLLTTVELGLAVGLFLVAARFWGVSLNNFEGQSSLMRGEFQIGSFSIGFSQVLSSVLAFLLVYYFFKLIRWFLRERVFSVMRLSISASEAVLAIFGYMGFTFAIIASLNALGVQWENLAIIAGALSVGIGFGLQTIISNFVSGLILLFERPVRVGDWVILGNGLEGHIKNVNMRSTEIMTLERSSVLIPNSNLLSDTITNWTLHDKMGRQDIAVGVAYGSDTEHVKQVLLTVAANHNLLRKYPQPQVLFRNFGDSSLDFYLRVFLKNIDDRHRVASDLRFAIDRAFRENDITIPFPQRDLNIKGRTPISD